MLQDSKAFASFSVDDVPAAKAFYADTLVLNFPVTGLEEMVDRLTAAGVSFEQYPALGTDERGIARMEQGPAIAWFRDPAGNILAVHEE